MVKLHKKKCRNYFLCDCDHYERYDEMSPRSTEKKDGSNYCEVYLKGEIKENVKEDPRRKTDSNIDIFQVLLSAYEVLIRRNST